MTNVSTEIATYNSAQLPGSPIVRCSTSEYACAAIVSYRDNPNTELTLVAVICGDYSLAPCWPNEQIPIPFFVTLK